MEEIITELDIRTIRTLYNDINHSTTLKYLAESFSTTITNKNLETYLSLGGIYGDYYSK